MKTSSLNEIKQELLNTPAAQLIDLCLHLARHKKENKELLGYLLLESYDVDGYIKKVKVEIDEQFAALDKLNLYFTKKGLRKILRIITKFIRYTGSKQCEAELLIYFCSVLKESGIALHRSAALTNLYSQQIKKIKKVIATMHEDLQYDYLQAIAKLV